MINFFRDTRKHLADTNRIWKYLRYAMGEIVLVVIGILIALSINNWNEEIKEKRVEKQRYQNILIDLSNDEEAIELMITRLIQKQDLQYSLYRVSQKNGIPGSTFNIGQVNSAPELRLITGKNQLTELEFIKDLRIRRDINVYAKYENAALSDVDRLEGIIKNEVRDYFKGINATKIDNYFTTRRYDNRDVDEVLDIDVVAEHYKDTDFKGLLIKLRMSTSNALTTLGALKEKNRDLQTILSDKL